MLSNIIYLNLLIALIIFIIVHLRSINNQKYNIKYNKIYKNGIIKYILRIRIYLNLYLFNQYHIINDLFKQYLI